VVASLGAADEVPGLIRALAVDLLLITDRVPHDRTAEIVLQATQSRPNVKVVVIDLVDTGHDFVELIEAGAAGLVLKNATVDEVVCTVSSVLNGTNVLPSALVTTLFSVLGERAAGSSRARWHESDRITRREHEIIALIAEGLSNKEIAGRLNIATFTVKSHVHNILEKLSLQTRVQVVRLFTQRRATGFSFPAAAVISRLAPPTPDESRLHERVKDTLSFRADGRAYERSSGG
jgi:DNA-binding NarL/FixJ family response regulator